MNIITAQLHSKAIRNHVTKLEQEFGFHLVFSSILEL